MTVPAIPVGGAWGRRPGNPTLLDRRQLPGWRVLGLVVLLVSLLTIPPLWSRLVDREAQNEGGE